MSRLTKKQQNAIKYLAVSYNAFHEAIDNHDDNGVCVWGRLIIDKMDTLGFDPFERGWINDRIEFAEQMRKKNQELSAVL